MKWKTSDRRDAAFKNEGPTSMAPIEASHDEFSALLAIGRPVHATVHRLLTARPVQVGFVLLAAHAVGFDDAIRMGGRELMRLVL